MSRLRLTALLLLVVLAAAAGQAAAASLGDPSETVGAGRLRLDGEAAVIVGRSLRFEDGGDVHTAREREFFLSGSYGLLSGMDGFVRIGAARLRLASDDALATGRFDSDVGFLFGGGVRYRFVDERLFKVGARLSLARAEVEDDAVTASWVEYDLLLGGSVHAVRELVPFVALAASVLDGDFDGPFGRREFRQEDLVGAVVGLRYAATAQVAATVAGRLGDQDTVSVILSFAF